MRCERSKPYMVPSDFIIMRRRQKSPRAVVERKIFRFDRQRVDHRLDDPASNELWQAIVSLRHAMTEVHWIAGKKLITAVATQRDGHVFARESRQQVSR